MSIRRSHTRRVVRHLAPEPDIDEVNVARLHDVPDDCCEFLLALAALFGLPLVDNCRAIAQYLLRPHRLARRLDHRVDERELLAPLVLAAVTPPTHRCME